MEAIDNLHKASFHKEMEAELYWSGFKNDLEKVETACGGKQRNGLINGCHLTLASWPDQLQSYSISPPRFSWQLFSHYPTGHCTCRRRGTQVSPRKGVGEQDESMRESQMLAETYASPAQEQ